MNPLFQPMIDGVGYAFEFLSPFLPYIGLVIVVHIAFIFFQHLVYNSSFGSGFCGKSFLEDDNDHSEKSDNEVVEEENSVGFISVYSVLLDKEIFFWEGDYAKEIKKNRLTVYYTDNGINKSFSCDLDDHIVVKEP